MKKKKDEKIDIDDWYFDRNEYGFNEIVDKQPKINLNKINAKEVLDLFNSEEMRAHKKAVLLLYKGYSNRYLEIGRKIAVEHYETWLDPFDDIYRDYQKISGIPVPSKDEEAARFKAAGKTHIRDIFSFLAKTKNKFKPTSEKEIGIWLDDKIKYYASFEFSRFRGICIDYSGPPSKYVLDAIANYRKNLNQGRIWEHMTTDKKDEYTYIVKWYFDYETHHKNPRMEEYHTKDFHHAMDLLEEGDFQMARVELVKVPIKD